MERMETSKPAYGSDTTASQEQESSFDFKAIYSMVLLNWQWFALSLFIFLCGALVYLRYKSPVYQVSVKMLIKDEQRNTSRSGQMLSNMKDLGFISNSEGIDNEVEILQSQLLTCEAVKDLKLYVEYKKEGHIKNRLIYDVQPVNVDIDPASLDKMNKTLLPIKMKIEQVGRTYEVEGMAYQRDNETEKVYKHPFKSTISSLPATVKTIAGTLTFTRNTNPDVVPFLKKKAMYVTITPPMAVGAKYVNSMAIEPTSKNTSIAQITLKDKSRKRGEDFLRQLTICYNRQANADKNEIAEKTEAFINGRLEKINSELGATESQLEDYKRRNKVTQLKLDATETLTQTSLYSTKLADVSAQTKLLDYLREYVDDPKNKYQVIPSNVGLQDPSSTSLINTFNQNVLNRNRLLRSASEISPQVQTLTGTLDELQVSIRTALAQARRAKDIERQSIESQYGKYQTKVTNTPEQERILTQIGRQQEVKSGLYLMLLQKREENSISLAATADKGKMIDYPTYGGKVSPKGIIVLLIALVLGLGLPLGILYLLQLLRYKIEGREDVEKLTSLPIVAEVAVASESAKSAAGIVVHENKNEQTDEIFRLMRTNIQFLLKDGEKTILFTSSTSGEGKTFNAANLSMSFALLGKKVVLIGLDIRKPALGKLFGLSDRNRGISPLLAKGTLTPENIESQMQNSGISDNLDLLLAGPTPPNPTELLAGDNLKTVIDYLKGKYDYVIMDTAPVGLVTDTLQISKLANVSVFVCRADYTPKSCFGYLNELAKGKKLPNTCVLINGIDMSKKKYGYYYGYGKYGKYGRYGSHGSYGSYGSYGNYSDSHYGNANDTSIKK